MANIVREEKYIKSDVANNNNKFIKEYKGVCTECYRVEKL